MSENNDTPLPNGTEAVPALRNPRFTLRRWRRPLAVAGLLVCGFGAGGFVASAAPEHFGWRPGLRLAHMQGMAAHMLDGVGATSAQEAKVHDIIAAAFADVTADPQAREAMRGQVLGLLRAPTVDRGAAEKLRADAVARFDAKSKRVVGAVLDIADQLTADQRVKLADRFEERMRRGPMGGGWRGPGEGGRERPAMDGRPSPDGAAPHDDQDGG